MRGCHCPFCLELKKNGHGQKIGQNGQKQDKTDIELAIMYKPKKTDKKQNKTDETDIELAITYKPEKTDKTHVQQECKTGHLKQDM